MIRKTKILYYSFRIGWHAESFKTWRLVDLKLPASCVHEAIIMYMFGHDFRRRYKVKSNSGKDRDYKVPTQYYVYCNIRQVIEYRLVKDRGHTVRQYKKVKIWNSHEFVDKFVKL